MIFILKTNQKDMQTIYNLILLSIFFFFSNIKFKYEYQHKFSEIYINKKIIKKQKEIDQLLIDQNIKHIPNFCTKSFLKKIGNKHEFMNDVWNTFQINKNITKSTNKILKKIENDIISWLKR